MWPFKKCKHENTEKTFLPLPKDWGLHSVCCKDCGELIQSWESYGEGPARVKLKVFGEESSTFDFND